MTWPIQHFTTDDLDAFHSASLSPQALRHLDECADCRALVEQDRSVLYMLESLEPQAPRSNLADRVIAQLARPIGVSAPVRRRPLALAASIAVALGASVIWSLLNRPLLMSWIDRGANAFREMVWEGIATLAQNLSEQPWIDALRGLGGSTGRIVLASSILVVGYAVSMVALRRLLIHPVPATTPKW